MNGHESLPGEIYLGNVTGTWPLQAFTEETRAIRWLADAGGDGGRSRRLWRVKLSQITELTLTDPVPARLAVKQ